MNKCVESNIISCAVDVALCGLVYLGILLWTKDETFFEVYDGFYGRFKGFIICIEYTKRVLRDLDGYGIYLNIIAATFLGAVYVNFIPLIFKKKK